MKEAQQWASRHLTSEHEARFLQASTHRQRRVRTVATLLSLVIVLGFGLLAWILQAVAFLSPSTLVTTTSNSGPGSLRQAIDMAPAGSTIRFAPSLRGKTIVFTTPPLSFGKKLTLLGPGADSLAISSGASGSYIEISSGATVTLSGLTFTNSHIHERNKSMLTNEGNLTVSQSVFTNITTDFFGGGIYNQGTLRVVNSSISDNRASYSGGGVYNTDHATLTLTNSTVSHNMAAMGGGGGLYNANSTLTLINTTVSNNTAGRYAGGGITSTSDGNVIVSRLVLINSTLSSNIASQNLGGGIYTDTTRVEITYSTIAGNKALSDKGRGGGLILSGDGKSMNDVHVTNSIIAGNQASSEPDLAGIPPSVFTSHGYNLLQNVAGLQRMRHTLQHSDVLLDAQTNPGIDQTLRGSSPQTASLLPGSPALGRIPLTACHPMGITTDERGKPRPGEHKRGCDIGAYEAAG